MASKKKIVENNFGGYEFASVRLDEGLKDEFMHWLKNIEDDLIVFVAEMLSCGWKESSVWDDKNDCYIVSWTMKDEDDRNHHIVVSSRSDNLVEASLMGYYKVNVLYPKKRLPTEAPKQQWG